MADSNATVSASRRSPGPAGSADRNRGRSSAVASAAMRRSLLVHGQNAGGGFRDPKALTKFDHSRQRIDGWRPGLVNELACNRQTFRANTVYATSNETGSPR